MVEKSAGYHEIEHTADWELEAWAPDLPGLLEQAARGMYALSGVCLSTEPRLQRAFVKDYLDPEHLVVAFLSELLYYGENAGLAFDRFELALNDGRLYATLYGAPILDLDKEIKAVTYHNLRVIETPQGYRVRIVFDV
jgi:SHS2 domain-containing protein